MISRRITLLFFFLFGLGVTAFAQPLHVIWDRSGQEDSSAYGYEILPLGDQNDDGYNDWAVFANWEYDGGADPSYLEFFHGGNPPSTVPYLTMNSEFGLWQGALAAGDVNGDGYIDWITKTYCVVPQSFLASVYFGGPAADTVADWNIVIPWNDYLVPIGDLNRDNYGDLYWFHYPEHFGQVFYGGANMDTIPDWTSHSPAGSAWQTLPIAHGDLNDDGYTDWVSCQYDANTTYIFMGGVNPDTVPAYTWERLPYWPQGIVKDINGDHYDDLVYGPREHAELHFGGPVLNSTADLTLNFPCSGGGPDHIASAGDFNRDGYQDLILMAYNCGDSQAGTMALYLGHPWIHPQPAFTLRSGSFGLVGIWTATGLGDVNGDGIDDIAVSGYTHDYPAGRRGRVVVIAGDTNWVAGVEDQFIPHPSSFSLSVYPNPFNPRTTISLTLPRTTRARLTVHDLLGREVAVLQDGMLNAGEHSFAFDGSELPSGVYLARWQAGEMSKVVKLALIR